VFESRPGPNRPTQRKCPDLNWTAWSSRSCPVPPFAKLPRAPRLTCGSPFHRVRSLVKLSDPTRWIETVQMRAAPRWDKRLPSLSNECVPARRDKAFGPPGQVGTPLEDGRSAQSALPTSYQQPQRRPSASFYARGNKLGIHSKAASIKFLTPFRSRQTGLQIASLFGGDK
jgi:hypothetical protein